ncbi:MAG TPA: GntR family transcriptional regulator [Pseudolysinimonas sp.]|nr:GntR family transcriptional regulator [Pseudolysinimonas sp.]
MRFTIDTAAHEPPFEQLRAQVVAGALDGSLPAGAKLPTVRALADELDLAPNTVARAYRELETAGVIETRGRAGSFVALSTDAAEKALQQDAAAYAARARSLGVDASRAAQYVRDALRP